MLGVDPELRYTGVFNAICVAVFTRTNAAITVIVLLLLLLLMELNSIEQNIYSI
jgi:hypothetical protein